MGTSSKNLTDQWSLGGWGFIPGFKGGKKRNVGRKYKLHPSALAKFENRLKRNRWISLDG
jgi:hypothetical protein